MNGSICVLGGSGGTIHTFDAGKWQNHRERAGGAGFVYNLAVSPDGRSVVSVGPPGREQTSGNIHIWSVNPLKRIKSLPWEHGAYSAAFSPDGLRLATADARGTIAIWDLQRDQVVRRLHGHGGANVVAVRFTQDGKSLLSGGYDKTIRLWDLTSGQELRCFVGHRGGVKDISLSPDGKQFVSASIDQTMKTWDIETGAELSTYSRHPRGATAVAFLPDGSGFVSGGENGRVALWNLHRDPASSAQFTATSPRLALMPGGLTAIAADANGLIREFDLSTGKALREIQAPGGVTALAVAPTARVALLGAEGAALDLLDLASFTLRPAPALPLLRPATRTTTQPSAAQITAVALSRDGQFALAALGDRLSWTTPATAGGSSTVLPARIVAAALTADGAQAAVATERAVKVMDVKSAQEIYSFDVQRSISTITLSADGSKMACALFDNSIRLWDLIEHRPIHDLIGHLGVARTMEFSADGKTLVTGGDDNLVCLWDVVNMRAIRFFPGHKAAVCSLGVSPDGKVVISGDVSGEIRIWDLNRPRIYRQLEDQLEPAHVALDADANDGVGLRTMGMMYAFRGRPAWAIDCLERARAAKANVSPLALAQCYWLTSQSSAAIREFSTATTQNAPSAEYLNLCRQAAGK
jgi:WD40 repeat protein